MTHAEGGHVRAAHQASRRSFAGVSCSLCALAYSMISFSHDVFFSDVFF